MTRQFALGALGVALVIGAALIVMLAVGYVPTRLRGPMNERLVAVLFGIGEGITLTVAVAVLVNPFHREQP